MCTEIFSQCLPSASSVNLSSCSVHFKLRTSPNLLKRFTTKLHGSETVQCCNYHSYILLSTSYSRFIFHSENKHISVNRRVYTCISKKRNDPRVTTWINLRDQPAPWCIYCTNLSCSCLLAPSCVGKGECLCIGEHTSTSYPTSWLDLWLSANGNRT